MNWLEIVSSKLSCPKGHGPLKPWEGKAQCWKCGWKPDVQQLPPDILSEIAERSALWQERLAAVRNLHDSALLLRIVANDPDGVVCKAAADKLKALGVRQIPNYRVPRDEVEEDLMHLPIITLTERESDSASNAMGGGWATMSMLEARTALQGQKSYRPFPREDNARCLEACHQDEQYIATNTKVYRVSKEQFVVHREVFDNNW